MRSSMQMRPGFKHVDAGPQDEEIVDDDDEEGAEAAEAKDSKVEVKQLEVQFKKKESDRTIEAKKRSFAHKKVGAAPTGPCAALSPLATRHLSLSRARHSPATLL